MLSSELEKLMLTGSAKIEKKRYVEVVEGRRTYSTFALIDAIKARDTEKTFKIYGVLKETESRTVLWSAELAVRTVYGAKNTPADQKLYIRYRSSA